MSTFIAIFTLFIAIIFFLFSYWKNLKDDHTSETIFSSGFILLCSAIAVAMLIQLLGKGIVPTRIFSPRGLWFWGGAAGFLGAMFFIARKHSIRFFELFESATVSMLLGLLVISIIELLEARTPATIAVSVILFLLVLFYHFLRRNYKSFSWYKSGRVGFASLATISLFFFTKAISAIFFYAPMVSFGRGKGYSLFIGRVDAIISTAAAFFLIVCIYNLSHNKK